MKIQLGGERGMLMAMRRIEDGLQDLRSILNEENWNAGPTDAVDRAWRRLHELMAILQRWRAD